MISFMSAFPKLVSCDELQIYIHTYIPTYIDIYSGLHLGREGKGRKTGREEGKGRKGEGKVCFTSRYLSSSEASRSDQIRSISDKETLITSHPSIRCI